MKIAIVSYWCIPYPGGVSTHVLALQRGLEKRGHEVDIISHNAEGDGYHLLNKGFSLNKQPILTLLAQQQINRYNEKSTHYDPWLAMMENERLAFRQALSTFGLMDYDLIHAQDVISAIGVSEIKPFHVPLVSTLHGVLSAEWRLQGVISEHSKAWQWATALDYYGSRISDLNIAPSQWLKRQYMSDDVANNDRFRVIPYGMDTDSFLRLTVNDSRPPRPRDIRLIICPARLDQVKGHAVLLDALAQLNKQRKDWVCWIVGDGPLREKLEQTCTQNQLQHRVQFLGHRNDIPAILSKGDLIVLPSIHDNLPYTIMEAQVAGKPVIASDVGGIPEMISHGENGLLFPTGRSDVLCQYINTLLDNKSLRRHLAHTARISGLRQWSIDSMIDQLMSLYDEVLQSKKGGG